MGPICFLFGIFFYLEVWTLSIYGPDPPILNSTFYIAKTIILSTWWQTPFFFEVFFQTHKSKFMKVHIFPIYPLNSHSCNHVVLLKIWLWPLWRWCRTALYAEVNKTHMRKLIRAEQGCHCQVLNHKLKWTEKKRATPPHIAMVTSSTKT